MKQRANAASFPKGKTFWDRRNYLKAIECFLEMMKQSARVDWLRSLAELTGGAFEMDELGFGKHPVLSPDGKCAAFNVLKGGLWMTGVCGIAKREMSLLPREVSADRGPVFSPDGRFIISIAYKNNASSIYVTQLENGRQLHFGRICGSISDLTFSPDSKRVAFSCAAGGRTTVSCAEFSDGRIRKIKTKGLHSHTPIFTPDGKNLVFFVWDTKRSFIAVFAIDEKKQIYIDFPRSAFLPICLSPDGSSFVSGSVEGLRLFSLDGKQKKLIYRNRTNLGCWSPSFSLDGKRLVFINRQNRIDSIMLFKGNRLKPHCLARSTVPLRWVSCIPHSDKFLCGRQHGLDSVQLCIIDPYAGCPRVLKADVPCGMRYMRGQRDVSFFPDGKHLLFAYECDGNYRKPDRICIIDITHTHLPKKMELKKRLRNLAAEEASLAQSAYSVFRGADHGLAALAAKVSQDNISTHIRVLEKCGSRFSGSKGCIEASRYIYAQFSRYGLETHYDHYEHTGNKSFDSCNIIATLAGKVNSRATYILCAHYDSVLDSPGAWDNASGVAVVLETARILSKCFFNATLKFICFSGEEVWDMGSKHFVHQAKVQGLDIRGVLNNDSIGYRCGDNMDITVYYTSICLRDLLHAAASRYSRLITYSSAAPDRSDSCIFVKDFGPVTAMIQDYPYQPNPYMHSSKDVIGMLSLPKISEVTKLNVAALAALGMNSSFLQL